MPPRWPRQPTRDDPAYRRLDDRMTFATHVAVFSALNSGLWFFEILHRRSDAWAPGFSLVWLAGLVLHGLYVFALARYEAQDYTLEDYVPSAPHPDLPPPLAQEFDAQDEPQDLQQERPS